jgi:phospholipid/cholesterol/gamma-HCH transport system substrate-binding protein
MLTRFVRTQLIIFTILSVIGVSVMVVKYLQTPTLLGLGRITVTVELPASGGLYRFANVTYRGVQIGKVTELNATREGARATLELDSSPKVPVDVQADVRSVSAVGEQYVDLRPRTDSGPYLGDGSVIGMKNTTVPQQVGPMLDQVSAMIGSIPKDRLSALLDESGKAFNGAGFDLGSLIDSSSKLAAEANRVSDRSRTLIEDSGPLLDSQAETADSIRTWARGLAGFSDQLVADDPHTRKLLEQGPGAADEASRLLTQVKPTLPVLLANLTTVGQVLVTYHASARQLLVLLPPYVASTQSYGLPSKNPTGYTMGEFALTLADPPACTVGFLPPSQWRSPADTSEMDTPDGLYCKLPQDSPIAVRGARNYPCQGVPGKRAPTVQLCNDPKGFQPIAQREHVTGPYPIDPNLLAQGVPPDDRVDFNDHIYGPVEGTPRPPPAGQPDAAAPDAVAPPNPAAPLPAPGADTAPAAPADGQADANPAPSPPAGGLPPPAGGSGAAPASFNAAHAGPSVAFAEYDPHTGQYAAPDGQVFRQSDLVTPGAAKSWQDLLPQ